MFCLQKVIRALTRRKPGQRPLIAKEVNPDYRILLLGRNNSGKTTFLKQARKKYGGFSERECVEHKEQIIKIVYKTAANLAQEMINSKIQCGVNLGDTAMREVIKESQCKIPVECIPENHLEIIRRFWRDAVVRKYYTNCTKTDKLSQGEYFLNNISRIASEYYIPSEQDVMKIEQPTSCITSQRFKVSGKEFEVTDTPGCESEELSQTDKKYDFVIYFISLSEFRTINTSVELQTISENIASLRSITEKLGHTPSILLYFTHTEDYILAQKYSHATKNADSRGILDYFSKFIESGQNKIYHYLEDTSKLSRMKLVYELMKHEAVVRNLKQINCDC